jgi:hypothetical protein
MDDQRRAREAQKVAQEVVKMVESYQIVSKQVFECILSRIIEHVAKNTGTSPDEVAGKTSKVIQDLPHEYGSLSPEFRSWEALAAYLYGKYLKELGML